MDYILLTKILFSVAILSWALNGLVQQWRNQHNGEYVADLICKLYDLRILINSDNRKDKGYFLDKLKFIEDEVSCSRDMVRNRYKVINAELDSILKLYKSGC